MHAEELRALAGDALARRKERSHALTLRYLLTLYLVTAAAEIAALALEHREILHHDLRSPVFIGWLCFSALLHLLQHAWLLGYVNATLLISRDRDAADADLLAGLRRFWRFTLLHLLKVLCIAAQTVLLIAPGIAAFYRYRLAERLMLDDPSLSPVAALKASSRLTKGHKKELFLLDLSFWEHYLIVFTLEYGLKVAEYCGLSIEGLPLQIGAFVLCTVLLLFAELHKLPLVETAYACAYNKILAIENQACYRDTI